MWLVWIGVALLALKGLSIDPVAQWSWWSVLSPFAVALAWFEWIEKLVGRDRRRVEHDEMQRRQRERAGQQLAMVPGRGARRVRKDAAKGGSK